MNLLKRPRALLVALLSAATIAAVCALTPTAHAAAPMPVYSEFVVPTIVKAPDVSDKPKAAVSAPRSTKLDDTSGFQYDDNVLAVIYIVAKRQKSEDKHQ